MKLILRTNEFVQINKLSTFDHISLQQRLLDVIREKLTSSRHKTFMYGTVTEKNTLKNLGGFGPIQDERTVSFRTKN